MDQVGCAGIPRSLTRHPAISPWAPGAGSAAASSADRGRASRSVPTTSGTRRQDRLTSTGAPWVGTSVVRDCLAPPPVPADDRRQWPGPAGRAVPACGDVAWPVVLVLLPPSEAKAPGGDGGPLDLAALTAPELTPVRTELLDALVKLSADPPAARTALGLSPRQDDEIARNGDLWTAPTRPAIERYTGVLYDALDVPPSPAHSAPGPTAGWRWARRCSDWSAPPTRSRRTGCRPARRCPGCWDCAPCGGRPCHPCSRTWTTWSWTCAAVPTPRSRPCPERSPCRFSASIPTARAPWSATSTRPTRGALRGCSPPRRPSRRTSSGCGPCCGARGCTWNTTGG